MSFVEIYNEQLFDLLLTPEACPSKSRQQRRFSVYGGNETAVRGKRNAPVRSAQKLTAEAAGNGSESGLPTPLRTAGTPLQRAPELAIYERPDGCTYVKVKRGVVRYTPGACVLVHIFIRAHEILRVFSSYREDGANTFTGKTSPFFTQLAIGIAPKLCVHELCD